MYNSVPDIRCNQSTPRSIANSDAPLRAGRHSLAATLLRTARAAALLALLAVAGCYSPVTGDQPWRVRITQIVPLKYPQFEVHFTLKDANGVQKTLPAHGLTPSVVPPAIVKSYSDVEPGGPVSAVLLVDISSSMTKPFSDHRKRIEVVREATKLFVEAMRPGDRCAIVPFGTTIGPLDPQGKVGPIRWLETKKDAMEMIANLPVDSRWDTDKHKAIPQSPKSLDYHVSRLYDGINQALDFIAEQGQKLRTPVIVLTDGYDDSYSTIQGKMMAPEAHLEGDAGRQKVRDRANLAGVPLYMIGIGVQGNPRPEIADRASKDPQTRNRYSDRASVYLDYDALKDLAGSAEEPYLTVIQDADRLQAYYPKLLASFQQEMKMTCVLIDEVSQDTDPGVQVAIDDSNVGKRSLSNVAQQSLVSMAPPPGHPSYLAYIFKRMVLFSVLGLILLALWFVPAMMGFTAPARTLRGPQAPATPIRSAPRPQPPNPEPFLPPSYGRTPPPTPQAQPGYSQAEVFPPPAAPVPRAPAPAQPQAAPPPAQASTGAPVIRIVKRDQYTDTDKQRLGDERGQD